jgi:hypothetical protein
VGVKEGVIVGVFVGEGVQVVVQMGVLVNVGVGVGLNNISGFTPMIAAMMTATAPMMAPYRFLFPLLLAVFIPFPPYRKKQTTYLTFNCFSF